MSTKLTSLFNTPITRFGLDECAGCDKGVHEPLIERDRGEWVAYCDECAAVRPARYVRLPERTQRLVRGE